jgi:hypothetical protein
MKKIIALILLVLFLSCGWSPTKTEKEAVIKKCTSMCNKLDRKLYRVSAETNVVGCVFNYKCLCYPSEGLAKLIVIKIDKEDIKY